MERKMSKEEIIHADYSVFDENGTFLGEIYMPENVTVQDMPTELEINGVVYYPQF